MKIAGKTHNSTANEHQTSCGLFFGVWQRRLENDPDFWAVRDIQSGSWWMNRAYREWRGYVTPTDTWYNAVRWLKADSSRKIEDAHSLALKTGRVVSVDLELKRQPNAFTPITHSCATRACPNSCGHCTIILACIRPVENEEAGWGQD